MSDKEKKIVQLEERVMTANEKVAAVVRKEFEAHKQLAINLMSSPGSGKTTLLCETCNRLKDRFPVYVIEGDQQTENDADRIRRTGVPACQVNTGECCHLEAQMIKDACAKLKPAEHSVIFIENVGNLVCPAEFDIGEAHKVVVLSVTEGEDKPLKYPYMFLACDLMLLTKTDLLPYVDFNVEKCFEYARRVNPNIRCLILSSKTGEGFDEWTSWIEKELSAL